MDNFNWKNMARLIAIKMISLVLAVVFLSLAILFLGYGLISVAGTTKGQDAKIISVSNKVGEHLSSCRLGGLFTLTAEMGNMKVEKIYSLYPAWPDVLNPLKGDIIRVWPARQPLVGAVALDGWGWLIVGTLLIVGLIFCEFAFLVLTVR